MIRMICYDIGKDKVRTRLAKFLEAQDFTRLQYSVFAGSISSGRWPRFWKELDRFFTAYCDADDRIHSHIIDRDEFERIATLGPGLDNSWILNEVTVWFV